MELRQCLINKSFEHYQFKLIIMSDLTTLFTMPAASLSQTTSPVQLASSRKRDSLTPQPHSVSSSPWNIADLESTLRKTIKEKMDSSNLAEELKKFTAVESTLLLSTVLAFFACILAISLVVELDHRVAFHLFLAFAVQLLPTLGTSLLR